MTAETITAVDRIGPWSRLRRDLLRGLVGVAAILGAVIRRGLDLAIALVATVVTAPLALAALAAPLARGRRPLVSRTYLGRWMRPIELSRIDVAGPLARIPTIWAVLRGDLGLVGPAPLPAEAGGRLSPHELVRFQVRPGLADLFGIRESANIAFEGRAAADAEQVHTSSLRSDLGILARAVPAALVRGPSDAPPPELEILGVRVHNWTMDRAVDWILNASGDGVQQLAFVNPDCLNIAWSNQEYRQILERATVVLPDGIGIHYACRMLGTRLAANVNGTDLFPRLCQALEGTDHAIFLLGGRPGVTEDLVEVLTERWPGVQIAGHHHGYFERGGAEEERVVGEIADSGADILLVAFGVPGQECWIARRGDRLGVRVALGVGGLFDFYSGRIPRAPLWLRELGLEWLWRLVQEPRRMWRRYVIGNPLFLWRVWRWRRAAPDRQPLQRSFGRSRCSQSNP